MLTAAEFLNNAGFDVVSLQHEYGIFGGQAGGNITELLSRLEMPVVTTLHTVLANPTPAQHDVMQRIIDISSKIVVMSEKGRQLLRSAHDVPASKIEIIPHGIPDLPFRETHQRQSETRFHGKDRHSYVRAAVAEQGHRNHARCHAGDHQIVSRTRSMSSSAQPIRISCVNRARPIGDSLTARVRELGIQDHVVFFNQFVEQATLLDFISMCDVYVTPYLNEAQMTSGTLAYSFGLGKAVVSTPYWHAKELLGDGRGILVPFGDAKAIGNEIAALLTNDVRRHAMRKRAYAASRSMTWRGDGRALSHGLRDCARAEPAESASSRPQLLPRAGTTPFRNCESDISFRFATIRAFSSTRSIQCPTAPMAIVSTTTLAPCCSQARLQIPVTRNCCLK